MTKTVLHIDASSRHDESFSRKFSQSIVDKIAPETIITRDLSDPLPLIDEAWVQDRFTPSEQMTAEQKTHFALSDQLVEEMKIAETIVIGMPIYNFNVPASLKLWIDLIARPGLTFYYNDKGQPIGLLEGKKVIVAIASGGVGPNSPADFVTGYLNFIFGFFGIKDVTLIWGDRAQSKGDEVFEEVEKQFNAAQG